MSIAIDSYNKGTINKHPGSLLDYSIDWSKWLCDDTIVSSSWSVDSGIVMTEETYTTVSATIWLSGGTDKTKYSIVNTITTAAGRSENKSLIISITSSGGA